MTTKKFELVRNPFGRLVLTTGEGDVHEGVAAVRAFPVQAPEDGIALVSGDGKEVDGSTHRRPAEEIGDMGAKIGGREFMPRSRASSTSRLRPPCTWTVETDRGDTEFVCAAEDIRRLTVTRG